MASSTQTTTTTASALSDAERVRLTRKDVQYRGIELERLLGKNLQAWYLIALNLERSQVSADRVGAMIATTQQQSVPVPAPTAAPPRALDARPVAVAAPPPPPVVASTPVVKVEPVEQSAPPTSTTNDMDVDFFNENDDFF